MKIVSRPCLIPTKRGNLQLPVCLHSWGARIHSIHHISAPDSRKSVAERCNQTILNATQAASDHSRLPVSFWDLAVIDEKSKYNLQRWIQHYRIGNEAQKVRTSSYRLELLDQYQTGNNRRVNLKQNRSRCDMCIPLIHKQSLPWTWKVVWSYQQGLSTFICFTPFLIWHWN